MYLSKILTVIASIVLTIVLIFSASASYAKEPVINTRGACLRVADFQSLIKSEARKIKSGGTLKLIIDTPNEPEAQDAIKNEGHAIVEIKRDKGRDSTTYVIRVNK